MLTAHLKSHVATYGQMPASMLGHADSACLMQRISEECRNRVKFKVRMGVRDPDIVDQNKLEHLHSYMAAAGITDIAQAAEAYMK